MAKTLNANPQDMVGVDFETYSEVDLKKTGVYPYAAHKSTEVLCATFRKPSWPKPVFWKQGDPVPDEVVEHVESGGIFSAWNAQFERIVWRDCLGPKYGWPVPSTRQWRCTMVRALAMNLPASLDRCARVVGLGRGKDEKGYAMMLRACKPRAGVTMQKDEDGNYKRRRYTPENSPYMFKAIYAYNVEDVELELAIAEKVIHLDDSEQELWFLDQEINDRGFGVDLALAAHLERMVALDIKRVNARLRKVTGGAVTAVTNTGQMRMYSGERGVPLDSVDKAAVVDALKADMPDDVKEVLLLRQEAGKSSTSKLTTFRLATNPDGRLRGGLQFNGAGQTHRWAGRIIQPQNFPRPDPDLKLDHLQCAEDILTGDYGYVRFMHGDLLPVAADMLRPVIVASEGNVLISRDLKQIEARTLPWLAGEESVLQAFRDYDAGTGPDIYKVTAASAVYGKPHEEITKPERQVGKVACIAEGSRVKTDRGNVPIEKVTTDMKVWDGTDFVEHDGVVYQGFKEVIHHDGIWGTPDHIIYTDTTLGFLPLGECKRNGVYARLDGNRKRQWEDFSEATRKTRVYDILNCGPKHRFVCNGRLVSNCLALGFGGGAGAFDSMAKIYFVDTAAIYEQLMDIATPENRRKAQKAWESRGYASDLPMRNWISSELVKLAWRDANPNIVKFWYDLEAAAVRALQYPGKVQKARGIRYVKTGSFLRCVKPSGVSIWYPEPELYMTATPWGEKPAMLFKCEDSVTKKWVSKKFYGGLAAENVTQSVARDVMVHGLRNANAAGYKTVLTVHDENLAEVPEGFGSEDEFHNITVTPPPWARGLPVAADGWVGSRYLKQE